MNLEMAIQHALNGRAILFAGSGFSYGAKNIAGNCLKTGMALRNYLADKCGSSNTTANLDAVAQYYTRQFGEASLIQEIKQEYTLSYIAPHHEQILSIPWKTIYTTNYDKIIETAASKNSNVITPVTMSDDIDQYEKRNICVHLNGYIDNLNAQTLNGEFKLIDRSYSAETLDGKPWFEFMKADFKSINAIIVVGFSMQFDIDIKRILALPQISSKVVFISKPGSDALDADILKTYGNYTEIGVDGFGSEIIVQKKDYVPSIQSLQFISFVDEYMKPYASSDPEFPEISDLYYRGVLNEKLFAKNSLGEYKYIVNRSKIQNVLGQIRQKRVFLILSNLGNGKTMFCEILRSELRTKDIHLFIFKKRTPDLDQEIAEICSMSRKQRIMVMIDNYYSHFDILEAFRRYGTSNISFLLTSRISINNIHYHNLISMLGIPQEKYMPIYINSLDANEVSDFIDVLKNNNLTTRALASLSRPEAENYIMEQCKGQISSIVLDLYKSSYVAEELKKLYSDRQDESHAIREIATLALAVVVMNIELDLFDMCELLQVDFARLSCLDNIFINEIFTIDEGSISVRSSIIAKELLYNIIDFEFLVSVLIKIIHRADQTYKNNKDYEELLKSLISHSNFIPYLQIGKNSAYICTFYDSIRNTKFCKNSPLFWEQYASSCIDMGSYDIAFRCIENAYVEAAKINFVPYQIATVHGRCIIEKTLSPESIKLAQGDEVIKNVQLAHDNIIKYYLHPDFNKYYFSRVGIKYVAIFDKYNSCLNKRHLSILLEKLIDVRKKMHAYSQEPQNLYSNLIRRWINDVDACISSVKSLL